MEGHQGQSAVDGQPSPKRHLSLYFNDAQASREVSYIFIRKSNIAILMQLGELYMVFVLEKFLRVKIAVSFFLSS